MFVFDYEPESELSKLVRKITNLIKYDHDYDNAIKLILENHIRLEDIVKTTIRLNRKHLINLASKLISKKG